jgi:large subunit ribosomal protein L10
MTREEKTVAIAELKDKFSQAKYFYLTDCSAMTVEDINKLRRTCFEKEVELKVVKNTLIRKALDQISSTEYKDLYDTLHGPTAVMFCEVGNTPAHLIKEFRGDKEKPLLKSAYIDSAIYVGDAQLDALQKIKSKKELLGELIGLLQSPMSNLVGALNYGGTTIAGVLKTLEERQD